MVPADPTKRCFLNIGSAWGHTLISALKGGNGVALMPPIRLRYTRLGRADNFPALNISRYIDFTADILQYPPIH